MTFSQVNQLTGAGNLGEPQASQPWEACAVGSVPAELLGRLVDLVAEQKVGPGGTVTLPAEALAILNRLSSSALGSASVDEQAFDTGRWVSTRDAAARMGCSDRWVRVLARRNALSAQQYDGRWLVDLASVDRYLAETARMLPATG